MIYVWALEQDSDDTGTSVETCKDTSTAFKGLTVDEGLTDDEKTACSERSEESSVNSLNSCQKSATNANQVVNDPNEICESNNDTRVDNPKDRIRIEVNEARNVFQQQDLLVPWHKKVDNTKVPKTTEKTNPPDNGAGKEGQKETVYHRFYHVFRTGELRELCQSLSSVRIIDEYLDRGNWCVILEKV